VAVVVASFRSKGLEEIYHTGNTRRIAAEQLRKCVRILQSLEVATHPEDMNVTGYRFHSLRGKPPRWSVRVTETTGSPSAGPAKMRRTSILRTTTREDEMQRRNGLPPVHPGEIIREDVLPAVGLSVTAAAKALGVSRQMVHDILAGRKPLSAVMCLKVARLFGSRPEFWMRLQAEYDLKKAAQNRKVMQRVAQIVPLKPLEEVRA
jgi:addiction module HigA family antidote